MIGNCVSTVIATLAIDRLFSVYWGDGALCAAGRGRALETATRMTAEVRIVLRRWKLRQTLRISSLMAAKRCPLDQGLRRMHWPCGLMDKALVFGTKDCRFESCQGHLG